MNLRRLTLQSMAEGRFGRNGRLSYQLYKKSTSPGFMRRNTHQSPSTSSGQYIFKQEASRPTLGETF